MIDGNFPFKDQVVRRQRNKAKENATVTLDKIRKGNYDVSLLHKLRRAEKGSVSVTCDVVANAVKWSQKRPGLTTVSV